MTRGKSRRFGVPSMRCTSKAKSTGRRCRRWALVGLTVCDLHTGEDPRKQAAADRRDVVAQVMQWEDPDDPRPLGEVMLEAVHNADVLQRSLRDVRLRVLRGEAVDPVDLDRLVRMSQVAHALAETTVRAGVQVELVRQARLASDLNAEAVVRVLARVLDALTAGPRAPLAPLGPDFIGELRVWLHEVVRAELEVVAALDDPDPNESCWWPAAPRRTPRPRRCRCPGRRTRDPPRAAAPALPLWSECARSHAGGDLQHRLWPARSVTIPAGQVWPQAVNRYAVHHLDTA